MGIGVGPRVWGGGGCVCVQVWGVLEGYYKEQGVLSDLDITDHLYHSTSCCFTLKHDITVNCLMASNVYNRRVLKCVYNIK